MLFCCCDAPSRDKEAASELWIVAEDKDAYARDLPTGQPALGASTFPFSALPAFNPLEGLEGRTLSVPLPKKEPPNFPSDRVVQSKVDLSFPQDGSAQVKCVQVIAVKKEVPQKIERPVPVEKVIEVPSEKKVEEESEEEGEEGDVEVVERHVEVPQIHIIDRFVEVVQVQEMVREVPSYVLKDDVLRQEIEDAQRRVDTLQKQCDALWAASGISLSSVERSWETEEVEVLVPVPEFVDVPVEVIKKVQQKVETAVAQKKQTKPKPPKTATAVPGQKRVVEKIVHVPKPVYQERITEVPRIEIVEKIVEVVTPQATPEEVERLENLLKRVSALEAEIEALRGRSMPRGATLMT
uniref:Uncharacterized protein n=1 Tax=Chromera velia CCMP2878 TaxID=1169474 RepID=A0A0G4HJN6_9ALVE|eukprot:Cvel_7120.t1-p1 / transcript=Cvel_7120.t1 / gene=Cvel_7120 / organism=Chromera_velia_CCMP2878 / gene_product=hypothetical protein / transcript_product=hypothetical protein / location=Cvel_scaffold365:44814-45869(+) / protein_length=352 / sequence_SO=supercontig / SO=protein_coding / is_pseudo=false